MIYTSTDYDRPVDINNTLLIYHFDESLKLLLRERITFEEEDSHAAPEPSVCCRLRNHHDREFILLYLLVSHKLLVTGEIGVEPQVVTREFIAEFPELEPHREYGGPPLDKKPSSER